MKSARARNLAIRISREGDVRVTVPLGLGHRRAEGFVMSRKGWILRKLGEIREQSGMAVTVREGDMLFIRGNPVQVKLNGNGEDLQTGLWRILREHALDYLPSRVNELAAAHGFSYNGLKIRKMTSRWGSCTSRNSINLNSWLVMLPDHLSDYVILHELAHTVHKNHSPRFWKLLDDCTGGRSIAWRKELHRHRIMSIHTEQ